MMESKWLWLSVLLLLLEGCRWCSTDACLEDERIALLQLKPFFNNTKYNYLKNWVEDKSSDCCLWNRVECDTSSSSSSRRVIGLYLNETAGNIQLRDGWHLNASLFLPFKELKSLYLPWNGISGFVETEGLANLSLALGNLEILDLSSNYLNDTILLSLSQLSSLKHLYLSDNSFTGSNHEKGFQWLSRLDKLETLDLSYNSLKNNILFHMSSLSSLKTLTLSENNLKGMLHLNELNNLTKLKNLDLRRNRIESLTSSNQGKEIGQLRLINLETLDLSVNLLRNNIFAFISSLSTLKSLEMSDNQLQGTIDIAELNNLTNLKKLDLSYNSIESLQSFKDSRRQLKLTHLEELDLSQNLLNDSIFACLKVFPNLKSLVISSNLLKGSTYMKDLGALTNLEELDMSSNNLNNFVACQEFKGLKKLETLYLRYVFSNGSKVTLLKLVEAFPSIKTFNLEDNCLNNTMITTHQESATHVLRSNVKEIILDNCYLNTNVLQSIGVLDSLKTLSLRSCGLIGSLPHQGWCDLRNLKELDISWNALDGLLPHCLGNLTSLQMLDISYNQFTGNLTPLGNLTSLRFLSLSRNHFPISTSFLSLANLPNLEILIANENRMVMEPISFLTSVPKFQLYAIQLSNCKTDDGLETPKFLYYQYELRYVDLSDCNFSGTVPLWLLENNTKLETLVLKGNSFTGPLLLPHLVIPNISSIDISNNKLRGQIPTSICSTFPNLERLFLSKNAFGGNIPPCLGGMITLSFLDLSNNQLSGGVPEELFMRSSLEILRLSNNNLSGKIVPTIFSSNFLSNLYLDGNKFVGEILDINISTADFRYSSLRDINLSNNTLYGKFPRWIGNVSSLQRLALSNNQFEGSIPLELCNLSALEFLELSHNNFSGSIPSCFNRLFLTHVHLNGNRLLGPLTHAFNSSSLVTLDLSGNNLIGKIPEWIGTLSTLSVLLLKSNHLDGEIPVQLCRLYSLSIIDLSQNMFSGSIPSCLGNLTLVEEQKKSFIDASEYVALLSADLPANIVNMEFGKDISDFYYPASYMEEWIEFTTKSVSHSYGGNILEYMSGIDLSCNKLTGKIPDELGNLTEIHALNLSHNYLIGVIPSSFSKLKQIESLDLSYNNLSGRIPPQLVELNSLEVFRVAHNKLSGSIPEPKAQFGTFDESSYEGNPLLCGPPLPNSCSKTESPFIVPTTSDDEDEGSFMDSYVFCVSFLVSYVAVLLVIVVVLYINPYWRKAWFSFIEACITACRYSMVGDFIELYIIQKLW